MLGNRTKTPASTPGTAPGGGASLLFADVALRGDLVSDGDLQFDGRIEGNLRARGVTLGEGAHVEGEIIAETLRVCGTVEGTIRADRVELAATAVVRGELMHGSLRVEEGARMDGRVCCLENPTRSPEAAVADGAAFPAARVRDELAELAEKHGAGGATGTGVPGDALDTAAPPRAAEERSARKVA